ncbi:hypothetical protein NQ317_019275 [Molorchus minor]|uniref:Uncharacterized protein n=1 Tax=Molorchus minor TaxID=1323400 RepID=A0ABQ9JVY5_9CUCU|nr:hypothetical protein NQ317_019275 [Molorchus minor]
MWFTKGVPIPLYKPLKNMLFLCEEGTWLLLFAMVPWERLIFFFGNAFALQSQENPDSSGHYQMAR